MTGEGVLTLVVNPVAGHGRAHRRLPLVRARLVAAYPRHRLAVHETTSGADAFAALRSAVAGAGEGDLLVVAGGDGTVHAALNACARTGVPLGIVPVGTGNDFCRGAGLPLTVDAALTAIAAGRITAIDAMRLTGAVIGGEHRWAGSVLSTGFDAWVNERANRSPLDLGALTYAWCALAELRTFRPLPYRLTLDDAPERHLAAMLVAVGNAGVVGGGMRLCPDADVTDGLLDVTIVHPVGRGTLVRLLPRVFDGSFVSHPAIEQCRARRVRVDGDGLVAMADGEPVGGVPMQCEAVPGAVRLLGLTAGGPA